MNKRFLILLSFPQDQKHLAETKWYEFFSGKQVNAIPNTAQER